LCYSEIKDPKHLVDEKQKMIKLAKNKIDEINEKLNFVKIKSDEFVSKNKIKTALEEQIKLHQKNLAENALKAASEKQLDLVLIAPKAQPPVAKIIDFKKFLYQEEKKAKEAKKGIKKSIVKDIKLSLFIGAADLERMAHKGKEFLEEGNQLRLNLTLKGREIAKRDMGIKLLNEVIATLGDVNVSKPPRLEGRVIRAVVARKK
jgi:translation initiation factor IF-3